MCLKREADGSQSIMRKERATNNGATVEVARSAFNYLVVIVHN